jgi:riboflavin kinase/FMN adenylyltransferase
MKTIESIPELKNIKKGCILTIGNFDGVHLGHQAILASAKKLAVKHGTELVAMTFEPHPVAILHPEKAPARLTPLPLKKYLLEQQNVDCLIILKNIASLLKLSPADFVDKFLVKHIQPAVVVEGETFNFGAGRAGSVHTLSDLGKQREFNVFIVPQREIKFSNGVSAKISSSIIRDLLAEGNVSDASFALSRPYRLIGRVISGKGKGRHLGFPTLNMKKSNQLVPAEGVYVGLVEVGNTCEQVVKSKQQLPAVFSVGRSETLGPDHHLLIEAHLLIANADRVTGTWLAMDFVKHIRQQQKFTSESALATQISNDCQAAKKMLNFLEKGK